MILYNNYKNFESDIYQTLKKEERIDFDDEETTKKYLSTLESKVLALEENVQRLSFLQKNLSNMTDSEFIEKAKGLYHIDWACPTNTDFYPDVRNYDKDEEMKKIMELILNDTIRFKKYFVANNTCGYFSVISNDYTLSFPEETEVHYKFMDKKYKVTMNFDDLHNYSRITNSYTKKVAYGGYTEDVSESFEFATPLYYIPEHYTYTIESWHEIGHDCALGGPFNIHILYRGSPKDMFTNLEEHYTMNNSSFNISSSEVQKAIIDGEILVICFPHYLPFPIDYCIFQDLDKNGLDCISKWLVEIDKLPRPNGYQRKVLNALKTYLIPLIRKKISNTIEKDTRELFQLEKEVKLKVKGVYTHVSNHYSWLSKNYKKKEEDIKSLIKKL